MRVRGLVVMIVACQVMDPGSIPGERIFVQVVVQAQNVFAQLSRLGPVVTEVKFRQSTATSRLPVSCTPALVLPPAPTEEEEKKKREKKKGVIRATGVEPVT